ELGGGAGAAGVARPSPVARGGGGGRGAAGAGGEDGGDAARAEHAERAAAGDESADVEGEALVLDVLGRVVEGPTLEAAARCGVAGDLCGGVLCARVLARLGIGAADAAGVGGVHDGSSRSPGVEPER